MQREYYIANCFSRIIQAERSPQMHKKLCDDLAHVFMDAAAFGSAVGHEQLQKVLTDAESGKYARKSPIKNRKSKI